ncbi:MAG TPA: family 16 glycosylhydrolase, partial [Cytophagaceae bacterium]|nr:family 16 glycosylhydrolase [Cytophagaceae bacterium]
MMIFKDRFSTRLKSKNTQKRRIAIVTGMLLFCLFFSGQVFSQCTQLVWQDEFNSTSLDLTKWNYVTGNGCSGSSGCGFGNGELEYYTSGTNNVTVNGSNLVITPKYQSNYLGSGSNYTSGKISTQGLASWLYGRMEASIKVPSGPGMWPAFWMLSDANNWPYSGEIDIEETVNSNPVNAYQTLHYNCTPCNGGGYSPNQTGVTVTNADWSSAYHLYAVDWTPNQIKYSIDGVTTATYTPSSLAGGTATTWPFNTTNFYLILNLALGGSLTGNANPGTGTLPSMYVDYVRVYSNPSSLVISGQKTVFVGDQKYYGVTSAGASATYNWVLPSGATIVSGAGTNNILVSFNSALNTNIVCNVDGDGAGTSCTSVPVNYGVKAIVKTCGIILDDFESNRNIGDMYSNGVLTVVANPAPGGSNTSSTVGRYARDVGSTYDILGYANFLVDNADDFRTGLRYFTMDVYSNAPAGTPITIEFDNSLKMVNAYPAGRHSQYTAVTGATNTWNKLTFTFLQSPDATLTAADVDRLQILFNPNSNVAGQLFYFDNFIAQGKTPVTSAITGAGTACLSQTGATYSVTNTTGSTYAWTASGGATIASGQG